MNLARDYWVEKVVCETFVYTVPDKKLTYHTLSTCLGTVLVPLKYCLSTIRGTIKVRWCVESTVSSTIHSVMRYLLFAFCNGCHRVCGLWVLVRR